MAIKNSVKPCHTYTSMMFEHMSLEDAERIYEDFTPIERTLTPKCECVLTNEFGMRVCVLCGVVDSYDVVEEFVHGEYVPTTRSIYKRRLYCMEKIRSLCGHKIPCSKAYGQVKRKLSKLSFDTIVELKQILKDMGKTTLYKYLYGIWFDLKGEKLIELTPHQQDILSLEFVELDGKFKEQQDQHKRSNIMSYASVLYFLMKKHNYKGYDHIILPYNNVRIMRLIRATLGRGADCAF